jgi:hypothetical protein
MKNQKQKEKRNQRKIKENKKEPKTPQGGGWWPRPPYKSIVV